jgi:hypothetical protein
MTNDTIKLDPKFDWKRTAVLVRKGQRVKVSVDPNAHWRVGENPWPLCNADGYSPSEVPGGLGNAVPCFHTGVWHWGSLIGAIADDRASYEELDSVSFEIGTLREIIPQTDGYLYLNINDCRTLPPGFADNTSERGGLYIEISVAEGQHQKKKTDELTKRLLDEIPTLKEINLNPRERSYTSFALKSTLRWEGSKLFGNWMDSFAGACIQTWNAYIEKGSIIAMRDAGQCDNGGAIVICEHY